MGAIASQIISLTIVYSTGNSDADQRKHQSSASLDFVRGIHRGPVNSSHRWQITRKMFPFDDVIMSLFKPLRPEWYIYASVKQVIAGSDNGLSSLRRQAIFWTNADVLPVGPLRTNLEKFKSKYNNIDWKMNFEIKLNKMSVILSRLQCVKILSHGCSC